MKESVSKEKKAIEINSYSWSYSQRHVFAWMFGFLLYSENSFKLLFLLSFYIFLSSVLKIYI